MWQTPGPAKAPSLTTTWCSILLESQRRKVGWRELMYEHGGVTSAYVCVRLWWLGAVTQRLGFEPRRIKAVHINLARVILPFLVQSEAKTHLLLHEAVPGLCAMRLESTCCNTYHRCSHI